MSDYKVEKNVPMPKQGMSIVPPEYPFDKMEIGDSFFVPANKNHYTVQMRIMNASRKFGHGKNNFATRTYPDGIRVWRIK